MSKIVVCKLIRFATDGNKFKKDLVAKVERTRVLVSDDYVKTFNKNWETSGRMYEIDKEATAKRNAELAKLESQQEPAPKKAGRPPKIEK